MIKKLFKNKKLSTLIIVFILVFGIFVVGESANATVAGAIMMVIGHIGYFFAKFFMGITVILIDVMVGVAQYDHFISAPPVVLGWVIVRDLCNMFFILILLVIAFSTILRIEKDVKKTLPKLLLMAVLINFSKTICGIFIDFSQIIMLTFVNSFQDLAAGNLTEMLGLPGLLNFNDIKDNKDATAGAVTTSIILAILFSVIACVVVAALLATLVVRIVMIWIYVVLSPIAYLAAAFPQGKKYADQWWSEFSKNLVVGPVLAFFIWLSFTSMGAVSQKELYPKASSNSKVAYSSTINSKEEAAEIATIGLTEAGTPDHVIKFVISIGMLLGGLMITQQVGGIASSMAGKGSGVLKGAATKIKKSAGDFAKYKAKGVAIKATRGGLSMTGGILKRTGSDSLQKLGKMSSGLSKDLGKNRDESKRDNRLKMLKKIGFRSDSDSMKNIGDVADSKLGRGVKTAGAIAGGVALGVATGNPFVGFASAIGAGAAQAGRTILGGKGEKKTKEAKEKDKNVIKKSETKRDNNLQGFKTERDDNLQGFKTERDGNISLKETSVEEGRRRDLSELDGNRSNLKEGAYAKESEKINSHYDSEKEKVKTIENEKYASKEAVENEKYAGKETKERQAHTNRLQEGTRVGKLEKDRDVVIKKIEAKVKAEISKVGVEKEIIKVKEDTSLDSDKKDKKIKKIKADGDRKIEKIKADGDRKINNVSTGHTENVKKLDSQHNTSLAASLGKYNPMKVTIAAVEKEQEDSKNVNQKIDILANGADITGFGKPSLYSDDGLTSRQTKFYETLCSSEEGSKKALQSMVKQLNTLKDLQTKTGEADGGGDIKKFQLNSIKALKQGMAAFSKGGGDISRMDDLVSVLDTITVKNDESPKSVDSYKDTVIANQ